MGLLSHKPNRQQKQGKISENQCNLAPGLLFTVQPLFSEKNSPHFHAIYGRFEAETFEESGKSLKDK